MVTAIGLLNALILGLLAALHVYWGVGGKWGATTSIPTDTHDRPLFRPGKVACMVVALGLSAMALVEAATALHWDLNLPSGTQEWAAGAVAIIFLLRAVGDFCYVGIFKKIKNTAFARYDTRWYTPLCGYLGLSTAWMAYTS